MIEKWKSLGLLEPLCEQLIKNNINEPTEVQEQAIPLWLEGKDITVKSQTGSGKTLAFVLPILQKIDIANKAIQAVIVAPTQELAMQIVRAAEQYGASLGVRTQQLIGGAAVKRQIEKLKLHPHLVVGTPGRMAELVRSKKMKLHQVKYVVLDEADQIFELGSSKDIEDLLFTMNKQRSTAFFSATYPSVMNRYESRWMNEPQHIEISPEHSVAPTIDHYFIVCEQRHKLDIARRIMRTLNTGTALIFVNDSSQISNWENKLQYEGFKVEALYGDADKQKRANTLSKLKEGKLEAILSTDVTARGIDIMDLPLVIQLEPAIDADHYVHRAGRTGRMGKEGVVISIITPQERFIIEKFQKQLHITIEERMLFRGQILNEQQIAEAVKYKSSAAKPASKENKKETKSAPVVKNSSNEQTISRSSSTSRPMPSNEASNARKTGNRPLQSKEATNARNTSNKLTETERPAAAKKGKQAERTVNNKATKTKKKANGKDKGAPKWLKEKRQQAND